MFGARPPLMTILRKGVCLRCPRCPRCLRRSSLHRAYDAQLCSPGLSTPYNRSLPRTALRLLVSCCRKCSQAVAPKSTSLQHTAHNRLAPTTLCTSWPGSTCREVAVLHPGSHPARSRRTAYVRSLQRLCQQDMPDTTRSQPHCTCPGCICRRMSPRRRPSSCPTLPGKLRRCRRHCRHRSWHAMSLERSAHKLHRGASRGHLGSALRGTRSTLWLRPRLCTDPPERSTESHNIMSSRVCATCGAARLGPHVREDGEARGGAKGHNASPSMCEMCGLIGRTLHACFCVSGSSTNRALRA